ncbi:hypothetical protein LA66_10020 [Aureimonas altamirensis]|uniref:Uncharacterized protein n=1 Tax=Aureimonas altamirensis TaxID=370622 RepID=A0A0B1Q266_9HYPH|nr:hypothetical protein [Aureimonas altamirensis]KHJ54888.1 hypothetical protein LA66_10020 [Aureimonas altamirensis]
MGKADEKLTPLEAEAAGHYERIQDAGGPLAYCIGYINHIARLKGDGAFVVIRERTASFPRMAVQLAAAGAAHVARKEGVDEDMRSKAEAWARNAWIHAAGHYVDQPSGGDDPEVVEHPNAQSMAMIRKGADTRKAKATEQWDRLIGNGLDSLMTLALSGHEARKPVTRKEGLIALATLAGLVLAIIGYGASHWYLSVKITAPYETEEGLQQRRDATDRVIAYDKVMSWTPRKGGIFKLFLDWPMSPTADEEAAFIEFATDIIQFRRGMIEERLICGDAEVSDDQAMGIVEDVNDGIDLHDETREPFTRAQSLIIGALSRLYPLPYR